LKIFNRDGVLIFEGKRKSSSVPATAVLTGYKRFLLLNLSASADEALREMDASEAGMVKLGA
jgi:hypothetical protein